MAPLVIGRLIGRLLVPVALAVVGLVAVLDSDLPAVLAILLSAVVVGLAAALVLFELANRAPLGYQDDRGFHYGQQHPPPPAGTSTERGKQNAP